MGVTEFPDVEDVVESEVTFEGNALLKARAVAAATGLPALADDSGLAVDVLGGAPGIFSARWSGRHGDDRANLEPAARPDRRRPHRAPRRPVRLRRRARAARRRRARRARRAARGARPQPARHQRLRLRPGVRARGFERAHPRRVRRRGEERDQPPRPGHARHRPAPAPAPHPVALSARQPGVRTSARSRPLAERADARTQPAVRTSARSRPPRERADARKGLWGFRGGRRRLASGV
nr:non-canonical purine NTP pyrophosphatase [Angustibacter aerolatus]